MYTHVKRGDSIKPIIAALQEAMCFLDTETWMLHDIARDTMIHASHA